MARSANPAHAAARKLWQPKLKEVPQCASCPLRKGNDKEFGVVVGKLRKLHGLPPPTKATIGVARISIMTGLKHTGDFICHGTAYSEDMEVRPDCDHRQCAGATAFFRRNA